MQVNALAPDGRCKAFGAEADGYGRGEGYTVAVLEPAGSLGPNQQPLVVLTGSAVNQDGRSSSLTVRMSARISISDSAKNNFRFFSDRCKTIELRRSHLISENHTQFMKQVVYTCSYFCSTE